MVSASDLEPYFKLMVQYGVVAIALEDELGNKITVSGVVPASPQELPEPEEKEHPDTKYLDGMRE